MERFEDAKRNPVHTIVQYTFTIQEEQTQIVNKLVFKPRLDFIDVFASCESRIHAIVTFLALLEMINNQVVRILSGEGINNFWIEPHLLDETAPSEEEE
jgi:segregation and condensation protein A